MSVRDVHERHLREQHLVRQADLDPLTGLANRAAFERAVTAMADRDVRSWWLSATSTTSSPSTTSTAMTSVTTCSGPWPPPSATSYAVTTSWPFRRRRVRRRRDPRRRHAHRPSRGPTPGRHQRARGGWHPGVVVRRHLRPGPARDAAAMRQKADQAMYSVKRTNKNNWSRSMEPSSRLSGVLCLT